MSTPQEIPFEQPRRRDRAMEDESWIRDFLLRVPLGTLATTGEKGPGLNPNLFVFDPSENVVYFHTAKTGKTRRSIERWPQVAFSVAEMGRLLPADAAMHFSVEYASVVIEGRAKVVEDLVEASRALDLLMKKYAPHLESGRDYRGISERDLVKTSVFRIDVESWSAKGKTSEAPDAYSYAEVAGCPRS